MRHGRRRRLMAGLGTALGLCAAGVGCQSARPVQTQAAGPIVSVGAPVPLPSRSGWTARADAPAPAVRWQASAGGSHGDVVAVAFMHSDQPGDDGPPLTAIPEPAKGPEAKKPEGNKDNPELPTPHPLPSGAPLLHPVPLAHPAQFVSPPDVPTELTKRALPPYVIQPPDVLLIEAVPRKDTLLQTDQPIRGQHLVRPDGTVGLGIYGSAFVGGMTIEQAREAVAAQIRQRIGNFDIRDLNVDVLAYNSQFYYVVTDGGGYGEQVYPFPITGSETVLDALGRINGLPPVADKRKVWVARRGPGEAGHVLPVDWCSVVQHADTATNYQLMPGDRVYVKADHWITTDAWLGKRLSPIERLLGATLLGSQTVNSIKNRGGGTTSGQ